MKHENDIQSRYISKSVQSDRVQGNLNTASDVTEFGKLLKFDENKGLTSSTVAQSAVASPWVFSTSWPTHAQAYAKRVFRVSPTARPRW